MCICRLSNGNKMYIMNHIKRSFTNCNRCAHQLHYYCRRKYCIKAEGAVGVEGAAGAEGGWPRRVVSGLQPTGELHVGNYFGAVRRLVRLQDSGDDVMVFVADLHALTTGPATGAEGAPHERTLALTATLLAAGLDPARCVLFAQSAVPRHAELCWLLACVGTQARLEQLPQYRERAATRPDVPLGLLLYPLLQAADVLVYRGTHVPVGADQLQHLQLAAHLARAFARRYGPVFPAPRPLLPEEGAERLRSLRQPAKKMSKSDPDVRARVLLSDPDDAIALKLRKAVTDCTPQVTYEPAARPGVSNLVALHCLAAGLLPEEAVEEARGLNTHQYKELVARALAAALRPLRQRAAELHARPRLLRDVLRAGAATARARADAVYEAAAAAAGLR